MIDRDRTQLVRMNEEVEFIIKTTEGVAANKETAETFLENDRIVLSQRDQIKLAEMLSKPPQINEAMCKAMKTRHTCRKT